MTSAAARRPTFVDRREPRAEVVLRRGDEEVARWTLTGEGRPDLGAVEEVARLALAARRMGCTLWLHHARPDLVGLLDLAGLGGPAGGGGGLQVVGEAEDGEEVGVEEVVMPDDPVA
jgi:hypothetical protein